MQRDTERLEVRAVAALRAQGRLKSRWPLMPKAKWLKVRFFAAVGGEADIRYAYSQRPIL